MSDNEEDIDAGGGDEEVEGEADEEVVEGDDGDDDEEVDDEEDAEVSHIKTNIIGFIDHAIDFVRAGLRPRCRTHKQGSYLLLCFKSSVGWFR